MSFLSYKILVHLHGFSFPAFEFSDLQGSVESYSSGVLEFRCGGKSLLKISIQLTTGDLLLRAGASVQDSGEVAAHIRQVNTIFVGKRKFP